MEKKRLETPENYKSDYKYSIKNHNYEKYNPIKEKEMSIKKISKSKEQGNLRREMLAEKIASATQELVKNIEKIKEGNDFSIQIFENISSVSYESSSAIEESNQIISEINDKISLFKKSIENLKLNILDNRRIIDLMIVTLEDLIMDINEIVEKNNVSVKKIDELNEKNKIIEESLKIIVKIADQTNLFALNAAIESSKMEGKGITFDILSNEIRELADISENSAQNINIIIKDLKNIIISIVEIINKIINNSKQDNSIGDEIKIKLNLINTKFNKILENTDNLFRELDGIILLYKKINSQSEILTNSIQNISIALQESSNANEEQVKAINEILYASNELLGVAENLKNNIKVGNLAEILSSTAEQLSSNIAETTSASYEIIEGLKSISKEINEMGNTIKITNKFLDAIKDKNNSFILSFKNDFNELNKIFELINVNNNNLKDIKSDLENNINLFINILEKIDLFENKIYSIEKIIKQIDRITIKISTLAVNGFLEASRFGIEGEGFTSVSMDIKQLTYDSEYQIEKINNLILKLKQNNNKIYLNIEDSNRLLNINNKKATNTIMDFNKINEKFNFLLKNYTNIINEFDIINNSISEIKIGQENILISVEKLIKDIEEVINFNYNKFNSFEEISEAIEEILLVAEEIKY
ncbi:methyl-accepting chemotaxis protein [Hypnocyclicus thermotrophus]|uniref:Methyl-accepting chemotaxis protein n=1 Tax=Hypnocyclicus thermotrophus TaxID=1627895 RepID=A0AA46E1G6_9FUSO|nr:methyl-accepting chemotaxis protein [Hypnocyclicus thermotrophus]TDT72513.1 methyl-accepting chemotaxis protein [Hypnocyclicus thermotrophus]